MGEYSRREDEWPCSGRRPVKGCVKHSVIRERGVRNLEHQAKATSYRALRKGRGVLIYSEDTAEERTDK